MAQTTTNLLQKLKEEGLLEVAHKHLVKGCDYLLVYPGTENPFQACKVAKFVEGMNFNHWRDFIGIDEDGYPEFETPMQIKPELKLPGYGATFYTNDPQKCDGEVIQKQKEWNNRRKKPQRAGGKTRRSNRNGGRNKRMRNPRI